MIIENEKLNRISIVLIEPKKYFLDKVLNYRKITGLDENLEEIYFTEENGVWIIPSIGSFKSNEAFEDFLESRKFQFLEEELHRFGITDNKIEAGFCETDFYQYFELQIRDSVSQVNDATV